MRLLAAILLIARIQADKILVVHEQNDKLAEEIVHHFNISLMYHGATYNFNDITLEKAILNVNTTQQSLCGNLAGVQAVISLAQSQPMISLLATLGTTTQVPILQLQFEAWTPPAIAKNTTLYHDNYVILVSPTLIFQNILGDVFPQLNISSEVIVLYDDLYVNSLSSWRQTIQKIPVPTQFIPLETNGSALTNQVKSLATSRRNILFVARTANIENFTREAQPYIEQGTFNLITFTKDITPFKCDECPSMNMLWIRPYYTGKHLEIRTINEYLVNSEITVEMDYKLTGAEELEASFYYDVMAFVIDFIRAVNASASTFPMYSCDTPNANISIRIRDTILLDPEREYGTFVEHSPNIFYQNVPGRIFRIDRINGDDDFRFNKLIANWTITDKLYYYYGSLGVDVRKLSHYRIVTLIQPPFIQRNPEALDEYQGYCIDLINLIEKELNFTYTLYEVEDGTFGSIDTNNNWNGLIGALVSGSADIALAPLSVMAERENDVDFTVPYYDLVGTTILMKKSDVEYSLFKFMKVLEWPVWLCIVGAYLFTSLLLWVFDKFSPYSYSNNKERYKEDTEKREFTLKECLWFCMTSLTPQGGGEAPKNISGRLVAATWWLFGFIIIASYTANLAAFLTVSRLETTISSLDDLAKQYKIEYAPIKGSSSETYFRRMAEVEEQFYNIWKQMSLNESMSPRERARLAVWDYPVSDKFTNMWRYMQESKLPENMSQAIDRVLNSPDGFAFIGDATEIKYAALTNCKLQQVGTEFSRKPYAIAVQTGHPLKDPISSTILMLLNQRKLEGLKETWWNNNKEKVTCPDANDESDGISIQNIGGVFIVILAGIVLSIITLGFEYFYYRKNTPTTRQFSTEKGVPIDNGKQNGHIVPSPAPSGLVQRKTSSLPPSQQPVANGNHVNHQHSVTYDNAAFQF